MFRTGYEGLPYSTSKTAARQKRDRRSCRQHGHIRLTGIPILETLQTRYTSWLTQSPISEVWETPELVSKIFSFLSIRNLLKLRRVNTSICDRADLIISQRKPHRYSLVSNIVSSIAPIGQSSNTIAIWQQQQHLFLDIQVRPTEEDERIEKSFSDEVLLDDLNTSTSFHNEKMIEAFEVLWFIPKNTLKTDLQNNGIGPLSSNHQLISAKSILLRSISEIIGHDSDHSNQFTTVDVVRSLEQRNSQNPSWILMAAMSGLSIDGRKLGLLDENEKCPQISSTVKQKIIKKLERLPPDFFSYVAEFATAPLKHRDDTSISTQQIEQFRKTGPTLAALFHWIRLLVFYSYEKDIENRTLAAIKIQERKKKRELDKNNKSPSDVELLKVQGLSVLATSSTTPLQTTFKHPIVVPSGRKGKRDNPVMKSEGLGEGITVQQPAVATSKIIRPNKSVFMTAAPNVKPKRHLQQQKIAKTTEEKLQKFRQVTEKPQTTLKPTSEAKDVVTRTDRTSNGKKRNVSSDTSRSKSLSTNMTGNVIINPSIEINEMENEINRLSEKPNPPTLSPSLQKPTGNDFQVLNTHQDMLKQRSFQNQTTIITEEKISIDNSRKRFSKDKVAEVEKTVLTNDLSSNSVTELEDNKTPPSTLADIDNTRWGTPNSISPPRSISPQIAVRKEDVRELSKPQPATDVEIPFFQPKNREFSMTLKKNIEREKNHVLKEPGNIQTGSKISFEQSSDVSSTIKQEIQREEVSSRDTDHDATSWPISVKKDTEEAPDHMASLESILSGIEEKHVNLMLQLSSHESNLIEDREPELSSILSHSSNEYSRNVLFGSFPQTTGEKLASRTVTASALEQQLPQFKVSTLSTVEPLLSEIEALPSIAMLPPPSPDASMISIGSSDKEPNNMSRLQMKMAELRRKSAKKPIIPEHSNQWAPTASDGTFNLVTKFPDETIDREGDVH